METNLKPVKYIYDSVHGYIGVTQVELDIINSLIFQRLHNIRHLGTAYFVYPGATQTRFAHSLGTMFVMGKVAQRLSELDIIRDSIEIQKLRLAALLHDIGHFPFSHVLEGHLNYGSLNGSHEDFSYHLITKTELKDKFGAFNSKEIGAIIRKEYTKNEIYSLLISSDLDVDRIDYLLRDAHETGVSYGLIDTDRIIRTIVVDTEGAHLAVEEKGKQALESFLLSRYHMYQTVYYHKTVVSFSLLLQKIYEELIKKGQVYDYPQLLSLDDESIYDFNDSYVLNKINNNKNDSSFLGEYIKLFRNRTPLKMAKQIEAISSSGERMSDYSKMELLELQNQKQLLCKESGVPEEWIFVFKPKPIDILSDADSDKAIRIIKSNGEIIPIARDPTSVISILYEKGLLYARLYTKRGFESQLLNGLKTCFGIDS